MTYELQMTTSTLNKIEDQAIHLVDILNLQGCKLDCVSVAFVKSEPHRLIKGVMNHVHVVIATGTFRPAVLQAMSHLVKEI